MTVREPRSIDHVVHVGHDFDQLAGKYEALGFTVTPRADHPFGTSNRLVVLENAYLELVAITRPELITGEFATAVQRFLRSGPGLAYLVFSSADAVADQKALAASGLAVGEVSSFSRPAVLSDETTTRASFSLVFTPGFPDLGVFLCQQHTPEAIWDRGFMQHPNGARRLARVTGEGLLDAEDLRRAEILTGAAAQETPTGLILALSDVEVEIEKSATRGLHLSGLVIAGSKPFHESILGIDVTGSVGDDPSGTGS